MVVELLLSAFLEVLFDRLASGELLKFARREGVDSKLKKWEKTLKIIQAVLKDAEEKQLTDDAVKMWLDDLQDLAYDVEDILDEFATEALQRKLMAEHQASSSKVRSLIPSCFNSWTPSAVKFNRSMGSKINDITSRLEELCKQRTDLGLEKIAGGSSTAQWERLPPTTCLPTEPAVYGRDEDKAKLLEMMSTGERNNSNFLVLSIVGMGGLGKTTLARVLYNDNSMEEFKFDMKAWVCVSDDFDILRISKAILESITLSPCDLKDLNQVQLQLKNAIADKRFLLVLDDVWSSNYGLWETLNSPFMFGASGSKIIVTTRDENVAMTVAPNNYYNLKLLSDDDCWSVFVKHAFKSRDIGARKNLEVIREKVVEKCKGLPLAARTLGGLLHSKKREDEWDDVLNSKIWDLPSENEIPPVLKLSYHHLPSHLKRCFAYCAILPEDYEFEEKELIILWLAEGLIQESKSNKQPEDLGREYFRDLLSRSIFQQSDTDNSKFIMHDLINDLAQCVSGETSFRLEDVARTNRQTRRFERVRHSSYTSLPFDGKNKFEVCHKLQRLRTFLPIILAYDEYYDHYYITNMVLSDLLLKFKKLRVLSLRRYSIVELPNSIGALKHLRYLNLSYCKIKNLPESTSSLFNLQSLILKNCSHLMKLPFNLRRLINLRHLDIRGVDLIEEMPLGMKELKCLQTLSNFIVGKDKGSSLKDLKDLKLLREELCISRLENVTDLDDIKEAILSNKKDLEVLSLKWSSQDTNSRNEMKENVLDMLRPHGNIKELIIKGYSGRRLPSWIGDSSFSNMVVLRLESCEKCTSLPSLGHLNSLKDVTIKGMTEIKSIGCEIYGESCSKPFQSLQTLCFEDLQEWKHWDSMNNGEQVENFPHLRKLSIVKCPKLIGRLPHSLPSLEELIICECEQLEVSCTSVRVDSNLEINGCKEITCNNPRDSKSQSSKTLEITSEFGYWLRQGYQSLERLSIIGCEKLICLWQNKISLEEPRQELRSCGSLKTLCVEDFPTLVSFPEVSFFPILRELEIINCNALTSLPEALKHGNTCLEELKIEGCHSLKFILKGHLPPTLKRLSIWDCKEMQFLVDDLEDTCNSSLVMHVESICKASTSILEYLHVKHCASLKCLLPRCQLPATLKQIRIFSCPELMTLSSTRQLPLALTHLEIWDCSKMESVAERFHNNMFLKSIYIRRCENLNSLPEGLFNLTSLYSLQMLDCPNFVYFPDGGLPNSISLFSIFRLGKLKELPHNIYSLSSIKDLSIMDSPSIETLPPEGFTTNLTSLTVVNLELYKALKEWGLHKFTSLTYLEISGCPDAVSFPQEEIGMMLPTSLTRLAIQEFPNLKSLSSKGFRDLTSLKCLVIYDCPKLSSFPEEGLPSSLLQLHLKGSPLLKKQCEKDKGREWSKIVHIPYVTIDYKFIYDQEEDSE